MGLARAIGKVIIEKLVPEGLSANSIIKQVQAAGGGYRRTEMLEDIRVAGGRFKNEYFVRNTKSNELIPEDLMVTTDLNVDRKYRVFGDYTYYDEDDDAFYTETKSFYTNDLAKKGDWEGQFQDEYSSRYSELGYESISFEITAIEQNSQW